MQVFPVVNAVQLCHPREDLPLVLQSLHCMKFCLTSADASCAEW